MPIITDLSAANLSVVIQSGNYTSFPVWIIIFCAAIGLLIMSRFTKKSDSVAQIMLAAMSLTLAIATVYGSLGVAFLSYTDVPTMIENTTGNITSTVVTSIYYIPVREVMASNYLTIICVIFLIISILNIADIVISEIQKIRGEKVDENKFQGW